MIEELSSIKNMRIMIEPFKNRETKGYHQIKSL